MASVQTDGDPPETSAKGALSILSTPAHRMRASAEQPGCFGDLHLDQIVNGATANREEYELAGIYHQPLDDPEQVTYRQDVVADLQSASVRRAVDTFVQRMQLMRRYLRATEQSRHQLQGQRWFLEAATVYCDAVTTLARALAEADARSRGLTSLTRHAAALVSSDAFRRLAADATGVRGELDDLRYTVNVKDAHVQVNADEGEPELAPSVQETFARFAQHETPTRRWNFKELPGLNHVEEQILDRVALLFPEPFTALADFRTRHRDDFDEVLVRFDREVQFYLGYLELIEPLVERGLRFARVELGDRSHVCAVGGFDLSLAAKLAAADALPVTNDFRTDAPERVLVVTGPNQGGKTTFARMIGQLHYLACLGLPVPATRATLALPDGVFTHFEREENLETLHGKFEDELVRIHEVLGAATERSVLVMNESFGSTTLADGQLVGSEIVRQIIARGSLCVFVSFIDELAVLGPETVSMMSTVVPEDPAHRTFRVERKPADGLAYAAALAAKYRLGYDALRERIG